MKKVATLGRTIDTDSKASSTISTPIPKRAPARSASVCNNCDDQMGSWDENHSRIADDSSSAVINLRKADVSRYHTTCFSVRPVTRRLLPKWCAWSERVWAVRLSDDGQVELDPTRADPKHLRRSTGHSGPPPNVLYQLLQEFRRALHAEAPLMRAAVVLEFLSFPCASSVAHSCEVATYDKSMNWLTVMLAIKGLQKVSLRRRLGRTQGSTSLINFDHALRARPCPPLIAASSRPCPSLPNAQVPSRSQSGSSRRHPHRSCDQKRGLP